MGRLILPPPQTCQPEQTMVPADSFRWRFPQHRSRRYLHARGSDRRTAAVRADRRRVHAQRGRCRARRGSTRTTGRSPASCCARRRDLDLLRLEIPEAYGGLGLDKISAAFVGEQIAVNPSFAGSIGAHTSIGTLPIVYFGTDAQKAKYLPRLASGELIAAYALTEPESGSDALAAKTTAVLTPDGRHYLLNGQKMWITNGGFADLFTIFAKVNGEKFTAFLVERGMGVVSGSDEKKLGLDGSSTTALMLDNVKVPVENVLGTIGEGHKVAFNILNLGRVKLGTRNMAGARQALANATQVRQRAASVRPADRRVRHDQAEARRDVDSLLRRRRDGLSCARRRRSRARGRRSHQQRARCSRRSRASRSSAR